MKRSKKMKDIENEDEVRYERIKKRIKFDPVEDDIILDGLDPDKEIIVKKLLKIRGTNYEQ